MNGFPPLKPDYPTKELRLTLDPVQSVYLWHLLDKVIDQFDQVENPNDQEQFGNLVMESIESKLADKLTFRAKGGLQ